MVAGIIITAGAFAFMSFIALFAPSRVTRQFDIPVLTAAGRNEVRAVYGGFGLAMTVVLGAALIRPEWRAGVCLAVGAALAGMATGRVISAAVDRRLDRFPALYLLIEATGAAMLLFAIPD